MRSLVALALLGLVEVIYVSGRFEEFDLVQTLSALRQFFPTSNKAKSDVTAPVQTTTIAETPIDTSTGRTDEDGSGSNWIQMSQQRGNPQPVQTQSHGPAVDDTVTAEGATDGFNPADAAAPGEKRDGFRAQPILQKDAASGSLKIGNFKTLTLPGSQQSCVEIARAMLYDIGATADQMTTEMNSGQISIFKICASNGSVVITCRSGKIVVSPRRYRPDDQCMRVK